MQPPACGSWRNRQALSCRNWASLLFVRLAPASQVSSRYGVFPFPLDRQGAALSPFLWVLKVQQFPLSCGSSRYSDFPFPVGPQGTAFPLSCGSSKYSDFPFPVGPQSTAFPLSCGSSGYSDFPFPMGSQGTAFPFPVGPQGTAFPFSYGSSRYSVSHFPFWPSANPLLALGVFYGWNTFSCGIWPWCVNTYNCNKCQSGTGVGVWYRWKTYYCISCQSAASASLMLGLRESCMAVSASLALVLWVCWCHTGAPFHHGSVWHWHYRGWTDRTLSILPLCYLALVFC